MLRKWLLSVLLLALGLPGRIATQQLDAVRSFDDGIIRSPSGDYAFSGKVLYQPHNLTLPTFGIPGISVRLIGFDWTVNQPVLASATTAADGSYQLATTDDSFPIYQVELDTNSIPKGYSPYSVEPNPAGLAWSSFSIWFRGTPPGIYPDNNFYLQDVRPAPVDLASGPFYLIVAPDKTIKSGALSDFVNFKQLEGFKVEIFSVEYIVANFPGANRMQQIRNLEINRLNSYHKRFKYALLVGSHASIPFGALNGEAVTFTICTTAGGFATDWFYADLTSNWDTNGNTCFGDGIFGLRSVQADHGYTPDSGDFFKKTVALGRIPSDDPEVVRKILKNSLTFERQMAAYKHNALIAASMMILKGSNQPGQCWFPADDPNGQYYSDVFTINNTSYSCNLMGPSGIDNSYLGHALEGLLGSAGLASTTFYENGSPVTGASPYQSPTPVNNSIVTQTINAQPFGLINADGHGDPTGIYRTYWRLDANQDNAVENPTAPLPPSNQSVYEAGFNYMFRNKGLPAWAEDGQGGIFILAGCETGRWDNTSSVAATLLAGGKGVAWVGGVNTVKAAIWQNPGDGAMQDIAYDVTDHLIKDNRPLGDAVWDSLQDHMAHNQQMQQLYGAAPTWIDISFDLYGDPSLGYWGNLPANATLAPWPMLRQDALGLSYVSLMGPTVPQQNWTYAATPRSSYEPLKPSPVVDSLGYVYVAHGSYVDQISGGNLMRRMVLNQVVFGSPALAADGSLYVLDGMGTLYAFGSSGTTPLWTLTPAVSYPPLASPVIGANGFIAFPVAPDFTHTVLIVVRPDGQWVILQSVPGIATGALAFRSDLSLYLTTNDGNLHSIALFDKSCFSTLLTGIWHVGMHCYSSSQPAPSAFTTPPVLGLGSVYVGRADGIVARFDLETLAQTGSFTADSAISAGPVEGPGAQILVGTQNGTLYSLDGNLNLRWQKTLGGGPVTGIPAFSGNSLYIASGDYLTAYNPASSAIQWLRFLGSGANGGSTAVGFGREVYVQTGSGAVVAIGEGWAQPPHYLKVAHALVPTGNAIRLSWTLGGKKLIPQAPQAGSILVQRSASGNPWETLASVPESDGVYTDTAVLPGTDYSYRLQAIDALGASSDFSPSQDIRSLPDLPPAPDLDPVQVPAADRLGLSWSMPAGAEVTGFLIERSQIPGGAFSQIAELPGDANTYIDQALLPNSLYLYQVVAINKAGEGPASSVMSATTMDQNLQPPQSVFATETSFHHIVVSWNGGLSGETAVIEKRPQDQHDWETIGSAPADGGLFDYDEQISLGYLYRVKFVLGQSESEYTETSLLLLPTGFFDHWLRFIFMPVIFR